MAVSLSCFSVWSRRKKVNGAAKVIPAVHASSTDRVRIFFFDDNIEWNGLEGSPGIVNLRDVRNFDFVEFGEGSNGFQRAAAACNTTVFHSTEFKNVLVQANILDAMEDEHYFTKIIDRYAQPDERLVVFIDVNSTIISVDSASGKDMSSVLLGTMFEFITVSPTETFTFEWDARPAVKFEKTMTLKQLAKKIAGDDKRYYSEFYSHENCVEFIRSLCKLAAVDWSTHDRPFTIKHFKDRYNQYLVSLVGSTTEEGITKSWFQLYTTLKTGGHCIMMNSYGVDTRKVIHKTVSDEREVLQIVVNFREWDPKDIYAYETMYALGHTE
jgi:hypothetical protein